MSSWLTVVRLLRATIVCVSLLVAGSALAAVPASWKDSGLAIDANGMTLRNVFEEFGRVYGVRLSFGLPQDALVKGRLKANTGVEFLDRLAQPYKFRWFVYNETLYVVPRDDNASVRLQVGEDAVQDAKQALIGIGLFDSRFGWGELPDEGIIVISGPRAYVDLARSILLPDEKKVALQGRQVMLFRLKYASATDRVITSRGRSETVPGVKTILSNLLFGQGTGEKVVNSHSMLDVYSPKRSRKPSVERGGAREVGLFGMTGRQEDEGEESASGQSEKSGYGNDMRPRIEADPTLNAIIIYDNGSKRAMYESLIMQMDIEPQQVEIEALIVDIDRNKLSELGVEWGTRSPGGKVSTFINAGASESKGTELPLPGSTLMISNAALFYARLKAMEGNGEAHVLATPTVLTLDNVAAVLDLSQTRYVPLLAERYADLANVTAGTMLRVIPRIVQDGTSTRVRLEVDIEDGALGATTGAGSETSVTRSTISTQAIVDAQQTLVIGGYHAESLTNDKHKVPVLGDVPLFGGLFRSETQSYSARERLFLITPRLVGSSGTSAANRSRVVAQKASSITRASAALGAVRPADVPNALVVPAANEIEESSLPAPAAPVAPPPADVSRVAPVAAAAPGAGAVSSNTSVTQLPPAAPAPITAAAELQKQEAAPAAAAPLRLSLGLAAAQSQRAPTAMQPAASLSSSQRSDAAADTVPVRTTVSSPGVKPVAPATARQETQSVYGPNDLSMTATSLDGVIERLGRQDATPEPRRQPLSVARPVNDPAQPYAGLLVSRQRDARAVQP